MTRLGGDLTTLMVKLGICNNSNSDCPKSQLIGFLGLMNRKCM